MGQQLLVVSEPAITFFNDMVAQKTESVKPAYITPKDYLANERQAFEKSEYYQGEIRLMAGASRNHNRIRDNVNGKVITHLEESYCQSFSSDMRVYLPETTLYAYPDIIIVCGEPQFADKEFDNLLNPVAIIEVLSTGTETYDRTQKFQRYQKISTFREYILIASQTTEVEVWRKNEQDLWTLTEQTTSLTETFTIGTIGLTISLTKVYARTTGLLS